MRCHFCGKANDAEVAHCEACGRVQGSFSTAVATPSDPVLTNETVPAAGASANTSGSDATRYLCAAVQMDPKLNDKAIRDILDEDYRAIASSPEVDLDAVLKYGRAARARQLTRDVLLAPLSILVLVSLVAGLGPFIFLLFAAWGVVFTESLVTHYGVLGPKLRREVFDPQKAPSSRTKDGATRRMGESVVASDGGNVTVFSDYMPFIGYGNPVQTWSFSLNLSNAEEGKEIREFTVHDLRHFIAESLGRSGIPGVQVEERLFVNGLDLLHGLEPAVRQAVLPNELAPPATHVDDGLLKQVVETPDSRARCYLAVRVGGWSGELVVTMFLRFSLLPQKDLLFVEANCSVLPPIQERYQVVDRLQNKPTARQVGGLAAQSLVNLVPASLGSVLRIANGALSPFARYGKSRQEIRAIRDDRCFNYGAKASLREEAGDKKFHRYFQQLDKEMYAKLVERNVIHALEKFMESHNIDTSELVERQNVIMNNGIYVTGQGKIDANSVSAGANAIARTFGASSQSAGGAVAKQG